MNRLNHRYLFAVVLCLLCVFAVYYGVNSVEETGSRLQTQALQDAISSSCAHSYATTGAYPPGLADVVERYALQIDESKYLVHYRAFASNIMPEISVFVRAQEVGG